MIVQVVDLDDFISRPPNVRQNRAPSNRQKESQMDKQPNSRMCFICGRENPVGLHIAFYQDPETQQVRAEVTVPDHYQSYPGVVHGGIVAAILDETAGRAVLLHGSDEMLMATLALNIRYRRPTPVEIPLTAVGWVERIGGVGARVAGEIRLPDGTVTAQCEATLATVPDSFRESWEEEKPYWKVDE